jgi:hypothetical protein
MSMDNAGFDVRGKGHKDLGLTLDLAFTVLDIPHAEAWAVDKRYGLVLFYHFPSETFVKGEELRVQALPYAMTGVAVLEIVWGWLQSVDYKKFKMDGFDEAIDLDGSLEKAWRVYTQDWGFIGDNHDTFLAIRPCWAWIGK